MRQLTPEQIGLDYEAMLELIGKERALDLIGEEEVRRWLEQRHPPACQQGPPP